jgi:hypothetical protein
MNIQSTRHFHLIIKPTISYSSKNLCQYLENNNMFRKRTKKAGNNLRRKRNDDGEHDKEGDDHEATGLAIRNTMKKQKILASLPLTSMGTRSGNRNGGDQSSLSDEKMLSQAAASAAAAPSSAGELSILASKHVDNMEAFIEQQMEATQTKNNSALNNGSNKNSGTNNGTEQNTETEDSTNNIINTEEDLYRQLAREVTDSGDPNSSDNNNSNNNNSQQQQEKQQQQQQQQDADQGDGGAALLVGTGIAEVILPVTSHRPVAVPTSQRAWNRNNPSLSSAVPEGERHKHSLPSTTPKPFVKFRSNTNNTNNNNNNPQNNNNDNNPNSSNNDNSNGSGLNNDNTKGSVEKIAVASSAARKGFDAFRGKAPAASDYSNNEGDKNDKNKNYQNNNNRRKTGKDRDDQVYSHFLKNALNGKRR